MATVRVVLDTNVLISGLLLPAGVPGKIVGAWQRGDLRLVMSEVMLDEVVRVLAYPKISRRLGWDGAKITQFSQMMRFFVDLVEPAPVTTVPLRDDKDIPILSAYLVSKADYLITGDQDLLVWRDHHAIITPTEFWEQHGM